MTLLLLKKVLSHTSYRLNRHVSLFALQGYPVEILPVTVAGIPSMHICLDFIPELVNQPQLEKQVWLAIAISEYAMSLKWSRLDFRRFPEPGLIAGSFSRTAAGNRA